MPMLSRLPLLMTPAMRERIATLHRSGLATDEIEQRTGCRNADICSVLIEVTERSPIERNLNAFEVAT